MSVKKMTYTFVVLVALSVGAATAGAHCEIPCGIYGDRMRIAMIAEDIATIEKSMKEIVKLSRTGDRNYNQLVRWVTNKDHHATKIQEVVYQYWMAQRVKPVSKADAGYSVYINKLTLLHGMIVSAMKTKQTTDLAHVAKLRVLLKKFEASYFAEMK